MNDEVAGAVPFQTEIERIHVDPKWNSRSGDFTSEGYGEDIEGAGFAGLKASIEKVGLEVPVRVQRSEGGGKPLDLAAGFRRIFAVTELWAEGKAVPGLEKGKIWCILVPSGKIEARKANLRENAQRENVPLADLAWGALDLFRLGASRTDVAESIGKTSDHTVSILRVAEALSPKLMTAWRTGKNVDGHGTSIQLSFEEIREVAKAPLERREEVYSKLYKLRAGKPKFREAAFHDQRERGVAVQLGTLLGRLESRGFINVRDGDDLETWEELVREFAKIKRYALGRRDRWKEHAAAGVDAYLKAKEEGGAGEVSEGLGEILPAGGGTS